jgi:hypothetical protein
MTTYAIWSNSVSSVYDGWGSYSAQNHKNPACVKSERVLAHSVTLLNEWKYLHLDTYMTYLCIELILEAP